MDVPAAGAAPHILIATYPVAVATADQYRELCVELGPALAAFPGLRSKTWLASPELRRFGGIYEFESKRSFDAFVSSELFAILRGHPAIGPMEACDFAVDVVAGRMAARPEQRTEEIR